MSMLNVMNWMNAMMIIIPLFEGYMVIMKGVIE